MYFNINYVFLLAENAFEVVIITNETTVDYGGSTQLTCVVFYQTNANISVTWSKDGKDIYNSSSTVLLERERLQGGRLFRLSYLYLCNLTESNTGLYSCSVSNGTATVAESVKVSVNNRPQDRSKKFIVVFINI